MNYQQRQPAWDEGAVRAMLAGTEVPILLAVVVHLTGDEDLLRRCKPYIGRAREFVHTVPQDLIDELHDKLVAALRPGAKRAPTPSVDLFKRIMSTSVGEEVPERYVPMLLQDLGFAERSGDTSGTAPSATARSLRIVVIGAGASGICAGIKLREAGFDFEMIDRNNDFGGVWLENSYPGCGVDTANHLYSYSFELNHGWSRYYVKRDELRSYLSDCAERHGLRGRIRFDTEVLSLSFDTARQVWQGVTADKQGERGTFEADVVISSVGQLNQPAIPPIPGLGDFKGRIVHSAQWEDSIDVRGKRVAIVGTGASGIQIAPAIVSSVSRLTVFQRSAPWVLPRHNFHREVSEETKRALADIPFYAVWYRFFLLWAFGDGLHNALQKDPNWSGNLSISKENDDLRQIWLRYLQQEVGDRPDLLAKVTPNYPPFGKRSLKDGYWYRTLKEPNVDLVTERIERITESSIVTKSGEEHPVDIIVFATGFHASRMLHPMEVSGANGRTIRDIWGEDDPRAYLGMTVPEFPNLFLTYGPNTNLGHGGSILFHAECQTRYIVDCLGLLLQRGARTMECRQDVHDDYNVRVDAAHGRMVWTHPAMTTWYRNQKGRVTTNSPWKLIEYWEMTRTPDPADFVFR